MSLTWLCLRTAAGDTSRPAGNGEDASAGQGVGCPLLSRDSSAPCIHGGAGLQSRVVSGPSSTTSATHRGKPALLAPMENLVRRREQSAPVRAVAAGTIWG